MAIGWRWKQQQQKKIVRFDGVEVVWNEFTYIQTIFAAVPISIFHVPPSFIINNCRMMQQGFNIPQLFMLFYFLSTKNNNIFTCISKPQDVMEDSSKMRKEIG